jgi:hypothetical protein
LLNGLVGRKQQAKGGLYWGILQFIWFVGIWSFKIFDGKKQLKNGFLNFVIY